MTLRLRRHWYAVPLVFFALLAACSGGGGSSHTPHPAASASESSSSAKGRSVTLSLKIPKRATLQSLARGRKRTPKWISASTEGAAVTLTVSGENSLTTNFNLTGTGASPSPNSAYGSATCTQASDGSTTCAMNAPVPGFGTDLSVQVTLYDTPPVSGTTPFSATNQLAYGNVGTTIPVTEGANVVLPLVLSGVVSSLEAANVVSIPASGGTGSFLLEGLDADGNIILASDGAAGPNDNAATFNLAIPPSISGVTLTDQTTTAAGSGVTVLANANLGDTIAVTASGTPAFVGVPLDTTIEDQAPADLGNVYAPVATASAAPINVANISPPLRIAGATFESSFTGPQANGFVAGFLGAAPSYAPTVASYTISGGTTPFGSQSGSFSLDSDYDNETITDLITLGNENYTSAVATSGLYFAGNFSGSALAFEPLNGSTNGGAFNISTQEITSSSVGAGSATFTASEDAGGYVGSALYLFNKTYVSIAPEASGDSAPGANVVFIPGSSGPISIAATIDGSSTSGENPLFVVLTSTDLYVLTPSSSGANVTVVLPLGIGTPVSIVAQGPLAYVLTSSGGIATCSLAKYAAVGCSFAASVVSSPSSDRHAMALGPDGNLWIATTTGIVRYSPSTGAKTALGYNDYDQIVASADGRLYASVANTGEVDAIP
jgi:hypothetical protein